MTNATARLADFTSGLGLEQIPKTVRQRAGILASDAVGIAIRGRHDVALVAPLLRAVHRLGLASGTCSVLGDPDTYSPLGAALINGTLIHSLDFDDTHAAGALHPSATALAAALTAAEMTRASGADLVAGVVAGYEVLCRLSKALQPADHYDRGFHPTATCGAFGAAAAAARVMGLSPEQTADAFGIVLSLSAGSMQFLENGAWTKAFQVGNAASAGLSAATLASEGFRGAAQAIDGAKGFLRSYAPAALIEQADAGLGSTWETLQIAIKPYPACRFAHAMMDAVIALRAAHGLSAADVRGITCGLSRKAIDLVGAPIARKQRAETVVEGQFSAPFLAMVALVEGGMGWDSYRRQLQNPEVRQGMGQVTVVEDAEVEALFPQRFAGSVTVRLADGRALHRFVASPKGEPDNFVTVEEIRGKFMDLVGPYLGEKAEPLLAEVMDLEHADIARLMSATRPPMTADRP